MVRIVNPRMAWSMQTTRWPIRPWTRLGHRVWGPIDAESTDRAEAARHWSRRLLPVVYA